MEQMKVLKSAEVSTHSVDEKDLGLINQLTLSPLKQEEVFTFKLALCDNEVDRDFECFPTSTLKEFQPMYIGKTVIRDHSWKSGNQIARIYHTELLEDKSRITKNNEPYTQLIAHCYMIKTSTNGDLIAEIKGGIKKEVSVGLSTKVANCSICGKDNTKDMCNHYWGKVYDGKLCYFKLEGAVDAYEVSFVAVPAQPDAGTVKSYGKNKVNKVGKIKKENEMLEEKLDKKPEDTENIEDIEDIEDTTGETSTDAKVDETAPDKTDAEEKPEEKADVKPEDVEEDTTTDDEETTDETSDEEKPEDETTDPLKDDEEKSDDEEECKEKADEEKPEDVKPEEETSDTETTDEEEKPEDETTDDEDKKENVDAQKSAKKILELRIKSVDAFLFSKR